MNRKYNIFLLPSMEDTNITINQTNKMVRLVNCYKSISDENEQGQHIYITSNEEIKEGDWFLALDGTNDIYQANKQWLDIISDSANKAVKIIASTDTSLDYIKHEEYSNGNTKGIRTLKELPQPSEDFIKDFISEYNKGNIITEVLVEYDKYTERRPRIRGYNATYLVHKLKINQDNTINISVPKKITMVDELREYFEKTPREVVLREWAKTEEDFGDVRFPCDNEIYDREDIKLIATRFAHECRLKGVATNDETCNLFDTWIENNNNILK